MDLFGFLSRGGRKGLEGDRYGTRGDISHLLFVTARPGIQALWTVLTVAALVYAFANRAPGWPAPVAVMLGSYAAVMLGNSFFPFDQYRPFLFFLLMAAFLALTASIVWLTGGRSSLLVFLYFAVPITSSAYYGYPGTLLMSLLSVLVVYAPWMSGNIGALEHMSLVLTSLALIFIGMMSCYVVEGEKMYARESREYRHLLDLVRHRERDVSRIYNLSRRFSYTLDMDTILKTTAALARQLLSCDGSLVFLRESHGLSLKAALGLLPFSDLAAVQPPDDRSWARARSGESFVLHEVALDWLPLPPESAGRRHNVAASPMFVGGDVEGYLVCFAAAPRPFRERHLEVLATIASQAAVAVEKARLYSRTLEDKNKVETILGALRDGLVLTDARGAIVEFNPVAGQLLGLDSPDGSVHLASALLDVVESCDLGSASIQEAVESVLEGGTVFGEMNVEEEGAVTVQAHFIPLRDRFHRVAGMVLFLHDITEFKRVDEMKSNFVSNVSHELRTPLTSISGFVSLLLAGRAGPLNPNQERYLGVVKQQSAYLTRMIEELLDLSRLQAGNVRAEARRSDLRSITSKTVADLAGAARERDVEVVHHLRDDLPDVNVDPVRITQVLTNVIGNAIKYTGVGGTVEITAHSTGPFVQVRVSDNGIGISPTALPHIFDRFFQARPDDSGDSGGFGLGLAITREIVELHGGRIWAESVPDMGSTFYFTLPVFAGSPGAVG